MHFNSPSISIQQVSLRNSLEGQTIRIICSFVAQTFSSAFSTKHFVNILGLFPNARNENRKISVSLWEDSADNQKEGK